MNRQDLVFIISPFILTSIFLVMGYLILIRQTPEAQIGLFGGREDEIIMLDETEVIAIKPTTDLPQEFTGVVANLPQNYVLLDKIINTAKRQKAQVVFLNIPVAVESDSQFSETDAQVSNQVNILRWAQVAISQMHEQGFHVILAMTLNAKDTVKDPALFAHRYVDVLEPWAGVANETGASYLMTGITVGHPLYSEIEPLDVSRILATVREKIKPRYIGHLGFSYCCTREFEIIATGFDVVNLIPTPEFAFALLQPQANEYVEDSIANQIFYYDRDRSLVLTTAP